MDLLEKEGGKTRKLEKEDVTGKVALITGASSGLGRVFSVTLAER
jgi:NADP-dependent 3-hydroxy acid dehydrogenase YdfG